MLSPLLIGLLLGLTAIATVPARRLHGAGWGARSVATYVTAVVAVGLAVGVAVALGVGVADGHVTVLEGVSAQALWR